MVDIFKFIDFRSYLGEYYREQKQLNPTFSYRYFSAQMGIKAPNFLQWIIEGKRNLSLKNVPQISLILEHSEKESIYFENLVKFGQAKLLADKDFYFRVLMEQRKPSPAAQVTELQYEHFSHWYNEALRVLFTYLDVKIDENYDFRKLGRMISPGISGAEARRSVQLMKKLNMISIGHDGLVEVTDRITTTGDEVRSFFVKKFHESMIHLAAESIDRFPSEVRDISGVTMSLSEESFETIKNEIQQTRKRILSIVEQEENHDSLYQLNVQLFPLVPKK